MLLTRPAESDGDAFLAAVHRSRELHGDWVAPPADAPAFTAYLHQAQLPNMDYSLAWAGDELVGVLNLSQIVHGAMFGAYLGFYAFLPLAGRGLMTQAVRLVVERAFTELNLHRVEANVQPGNHRSIALVQRAGFHREGFSPRYLHIAGQWRDHERWAVLNEGWAAW